MTNVGFIGLPGSGKSTVFKALTRQAVAPQFLGYDLKPHQAVVKIPDERLDWLSDMYQARNKVEATLEVVDLPGFDPATTERKLLNSVLEHYRKSDALALVVNLFDADAAPKAAAGLQAILDELVLLGLVTAETCAKRLEKAATHRSNQEAAAKYKALCKVKELLEEGLPIRRMPLNDNEQKLLREYAFISEKPVIVVLNVADEDVSKPDPEIPGLAECLKIAEEEGLVTVRLAASLQAELSEMDDEEAQEYMGEFGVAERALTQLIRAAHDALGLMTFLTGSEKECRSWSVRRGANAQQAAGVIHSDMARGFIRAETVGYEDLKAAGTFAAAKAAGKVRLEGKEYILVDGDILSIRFNV